MVAMRKPDWKCVFTYVQSIYRRFKDEWPPPQRPRDSLPPTARPPPERTSTSNSLAESKIAIAFRELLLLVWTLKILSWDSIHDMKLISVSKSVTLVVIQSEVKIPATGRWPRSGRVAGVEGWRRGGGAARRSHKCFARSALVQRVYVIVCFVINVYVSVRPARISERCLDSPPIYCNLNMWFFSTIVCKH